MSRVSRPQLSTAIEQFLHWRERNGWRSDSYGANRTTIRSYRAELARFQRFADHAALGDPYVGDIDRELIERFRLSISLGRRVGAGNLRPLSLETTKRRLVVLRQLLRYANRRGVTAVDPNNAAYADAIFNGYSRRWFAAGGVGHVFETRNGGSRGPLLRQPDGHRVTRRSLRGGIGRGGKALRRATQARF